MKKNENKIRNIGGFSLIELLFAIVFLTIIVFGVIRLQTSNLALGNTRNNELQAHFLANQGVTVAEAIGYEAFNSECGSSSCFCTLNEASVTGCIDTSGVPTPEDIGDNYYRIVRLDRSVTFPRMFIVTSTIEWTDSTGPHTIADGGAVSAKRVIY